jgi:hypothetical protein
MKRLSSRTRALLAGVALIVVTNAAVLAGVAYNRSGEPESVLALTERELRLRHWTWPAGENASIDVSLTWRVARAEPVDDAHFSWRYGALRLEPRQLQELGFDVPNDPGSEAGRQSVSRQPSRRAWVVLEYDGPAYQASVEEARRKLERAAELAAAKPGDSELEKQLMDARHAMQWVENAQTRLFVVDAGRDEQQLRARYPDRRHYLIVNARLRPTIIEGPGPKRMAVNVGELYVKTIRVPHAYRALVEPLVQQGYYDGEPRFTATVNFGRRLEPWIADLALIKSER